MLSRAVRSSTDPIGVERGLVAGGRPGGECGERLEGHARRGGSHAGQTSIAQTSVYAAGLGFRGKANGIPG
jgi:hypothetical protein